MRISMKAIVLMMSVLLTFSVNAKNYKLATNTPADSPAGELLQDFADNVKAKTDGRVSIKIYWGGALGGQGEYMQQIQSGVIGFGLLSSAALEGVDSAFGVINLPYMFRSLDEYGHVLNSDYIQKEFLPRTKNYNIEILGYLSNGFRSIYTTKPINSIEDLKGMKLRTAATDIYIEMLKLFGAVPVPVPFTEVYTAMQQGMVEGAEGSLAGLWEIKFGEVAKYGVRTEQTRLTDFIVANTKLMERIDPKDADIIRSEMSKASVLSLDKVDRVHAESEQLAVEKMGAVLTDIDKTPFINAVKPLYEKARQNKDHKIVLESIFELQDRAL
ncbi:TRAP transporter substrate-binding protein [Parasalinivibrio latis]|uniref:TRAP transporter substrate-binding protein n=1 Tax=Parasalinivibrio latis TaxID=2952610 RepID=UPI0030E2033E